MKSFNQLSGSQKLTGVVTLLYIGAAYYHFKGGRKALGTMFLGYTVANSALIYLEGV